MKMVMKQHDVKKRMRLLRAWDWQCVLCGLHFENLHSVTIEHLIPRSHGGSRRGKENTAPSHYNCNNHRGNLSLVDAVHVLARKREAMGTKAFAEWVNRKVPNRIIPPELLKTCTLPPSMRA